MADYLLREDAPLTKDQWDSIDKTVVNAVKPILVGRRFLPLFGPLGAGAFVVPNGYLSDGPDVKLTKLKLLFQDFTYDWRDIQYFEENRLPFDTGKVYDAAVKLAADEDRLIFYGDAETCADGILTVEGKLEYQRKDWQANSAYDDVVAALAVFACCLKAKLSFWQLCNGG